MKYEDMTPRQRQLSKKALCPICEQSIVPFEDIQIIKINYGKRVLHSFIHTGCILNSMFSSQLESEGINYAEAK